jgi:hypothetical protein
MSLTREDLAAAGRQDEPLYLVDICEAIGVTDPDAPGALSGASGNEPAPISLAAADEPSEARDAERDCRYSDESTRPAISRATVIA